MIYSSLVPFIDTLIKLALAMFFYVATSYPINSLLHYQHLYKDKLQIFTLLKYISFKINFVSHYMLFIIDFQLFSKNEFQ